MMRVVPFEIMHLLQLDLDEEQARVRDNEIATMTSARYQVPGKAFTGLVDGKPIACAGMMPMWRGRDLAWAFFGRDMPTRSWVFFAKHLRRAVDASLSNGTWRVEMTVKHGFANGCRLARLLGFNMEAVLAKYGPDGEDHIMYARTR